MAESTASQKTADNGIRYTAALTGDVVKEHQLYYQLAQSIARAEEIDLIVSFLMESGVRMILSELRAASQRGARIRILTGSYLGITQPSALYLIKYELGDNVELRFYNERGRSFHPKAYIFRYADVREIYIGSSNLSRSALSSGIEWNYRLRNIDRPEDFRAFYQTFEALWNQHSIIVDDDELQRYSKSWHRPAAFKDLQKLETAGKVHTTVSLYQPRGAQIEALYALQCSRNEGAARALIQAATGVGKTYLAAFDSQWAQRVLFVAHREEILRQAARSFYNVRHSEDYGFFCGKEKALGKAVLFASVATLGRKEYLTESVYPPDYFDYIVIDECHHAVNASYQNILDYFQPRFVLGLTATPERMDGRSIYEICDYNVPYEISLYEAINKGLLVPFHYYGIYDETDYGDLHLVKGHYQERDLNRKYLGNVRRYEIIRKHYQKYHSRQALGFCASKEHARDMAREFNQAGIASAAVCSQSVGAEFLPREEALCQLRQGSLRVIFAVDMFNEGVDIPSLDMVMFLRPTESPIVFLQQLGRGLRTAKGKEYLNVLDFIGNYETAGRISSCLTGKNRQDDEGKKEKSEAPEYPDGCQVDFDIRLIDMFQILSQRRLTIHERIRCEFLRVEELLGHVPTRVELFTNMDGAVYACCLKNRAENPFKHYADFLHEQGKLRADEESWYHTIAREFLLEIETTLMTKIYKMPVLYAFYNHGDIRMDITEDQAMISWKEFFDRGTNWKDFKPGITREEYQALTGQDHRKKIRQMPVKHLQGMMFFVKAGYLLSIREELRPFIQLASFRAHFADILAYRTQDYYRRRRYEEPSVLVLAEMETNKNLV